MNVSQSKYSAAQVNAYLKCDISYTQISCCNAGTYRADKGGVGNRLLSIDINYWQLNNLINPFIGRFSVFHLAFQHNSKINPVHSIKYSSVIPQKFQEIFMQDFRNTLK